MCPGEEKKLDKWKGKDRIYFFYSKGSCSGNLNFKSEIAYNIIDKFFTDTVYVKHKLSDDLPQEL